MSMEQKNLQAWNEMAEGLYSFLNERKTTINYEFSEFTVGVPQSTGVGSESALWSLNGQISISTNEAEDD